MQKLLAGLATAAALALFASSAQAECAFHNKHVTASADPQESVAVSTYDGPAPVVVADETVQAATECAADQKDCAPSDK
jgi:hypothetical protein